MRVRNKLLVALALILALISGCYVRDYLHNKNEEAQKRVATYAAQEVEQAVQLSRQFGYSLMENPYNPDTNALSQAGALLGKADKQRGVRQSTYSDLLMRHAMSSALIEQGVRPQYDELGKYFSTEKGLTPPETVAKDKLEQEHYINSLTSFLVNQKVPNQVTNAFRVFDENYRRENP